MHNNPIVSVVVITYNSARFIVDTLHSIYEQTYSNLELIISDDASTDDTVDIIKSWATKYGKRFLNHEIIESKINTGITCNCNRGITASKGTYVKLVSGDDLLFPECIEKLTNYAFINSTPLLYSKVLPFFEAGEQSFKDKIMQYEPIMYEMFHFCANEQYQKLLNGYQMYTVGVFFERNFFLNIGGFNEEYKMMEDYPFALKVTEKGQKLQLLDEYLVHYRVRSSAGESFFKLSQRNTIHSLDLKKFEENEIIPRLYREKRYLDLYNLYVRRIALRIISCGNNKFFEYAGKIFGYFSTNKIAARIKMINLKIHKICS